MQTKQVISKLTSGIESIRGTLVLDPLNVFIPFRLSSFTFSTEVSTGRLSLALILISSFSKFGDILALFEWDVALSDTESENCFPNVNKTDSRSTGWVFASCFKDWVTVFSGCPDLAWSGLWAFPELECLLLSPCTFFLDSDLTAVEVIWLWLDADLSEPWEDSLVFIELYRLCDEELDSRTLGFGSRLEVLLNLSSLFFNSDLPVICCLFVIPAPWSVLSFSFFSLLLPTASAISLFWILEFRAGFWKNPSSGCFEGNGVAGCLSTPSKSDFLDAAEESISFDARS